MENLHAEQRTSHLVDDLKAQLLIGIDVMGPEQISSDFKHRRAIIGSCDDIAVPVGICAKPDHVKNRPVYASRTIIRPKQSGRVPIKVKTTLPRDRDLIPDPQLPNAAKLQALAQLVDFSITHVDVFIASTDPVVIDDTIEIGTFRLGQDECWDMRKEEDRATIDMRIWRGMNYTP
ncbi:uncharacterized protein N7503_010344 [Penicillium pulvis]|uniref:uncharacterized protein n=1 Tax=Penicillium pulvis TaxID=1562058 RepID=UPI0025498901|nr:uncharacterized protein N7503_010344 [Penicillium pulvis]KAJ5785132.1 hypothetical protein N7503_010344 [Penicillium pulvis]